MKRTIHTVEGFFGGLFGRVHQPTAARASHPHAPGPNTPPQSELNAWLQSASPELDWTPPHLRLLQAELQSVTEGKVDRLMLFLPPRHGKSELVTVRYPVFRLEQNPELRVLIGAYNQQLAERFSRKARRVASSRGLLRCSLPPELGGRGGLRATAGEWETAEGGIVRAIGVGSGVTGLGADLILIDDPVKSREEAESQTYRDRVWDWYRDDLYTRQEPGCAIILVMTRWHEDDLAGRILASEEGPSWRVIRLPALAESPEEYQTYAQRPYPANETDQPVVGAHAVVALVQPTEQGSANSAPTPEPTADPTSGIRFSGFPPDSPVNSLPGGATPASASPAERQPTGDATNEAVGTPPNPNLQFAFCNSQFAISGDPLGREENEPLWPSRFNTQALERIKTTLGSRSFAALYQGRPMPAEGGLFQRAWFQLLDALPGVGLPGSAARSGQPSGEHASPPCVAPELGARGLPDSGTMSNLERMRHARRLARGDHGPVPPLQPSRDRAEQDYNEYRRRLAERSPLTSNQQPGTSNIRWVRFWDTAAKAGQRSDYWAGALLGRGANGDWYLASIVRGRWEYPEAKRRVLQFAALDGPDVPVVIEDSASGSALLQDLRCDPAAAGYLIKAERVATDKAVRAGAWASLAEAGRFHLLRAPWNAAFLEEAESFPHSAHDDQIDAVSGAHAYLFRVSRIPRVIAFAGRSR